VAEATSVVRAGLRLWWDHWPTLLTIFLFGQAVRAGVLWAAMKATAWHAWAGQALLPFAPLATVAALILALRVVAPSLRWVSFQTAGDEAGAARPHVVRDRLALLSSTLIPFFAIYAAQGYLRQDTRQFLNETAADTFNNDADFWQGTGQLAVDRLALPEGGWFWGTVAVAFGLRWLIDRLDLPERHHGWGLLAAYVEVAWVALFAKMVMNKFSEWTDWLKDRQAAVTTRTAYEEATSSLGGVGDLVDRVVGLVTSTIGQADAIIIVPMAWLTVGAVVYGRSLSSLKADEPSARASAWAARMRRVPAPVKRVGEEVLSGPIDRFKGLAAALRTFARAGLAPMLLFCLVFVLATQVKTGVAWLLRAAIGPREPSFMQVITPYGDLLVNGAYTVLMVALLAAAVDRILAPSPGQEPGSTGTTMTDGRSHQIRT
jgi:hypothetical protein